LDGRSFLPQAKGEKGSPREWIYSWYSPRQSADKTVREFAFNQEYKLYRTGELFDLRHDPAEKRPLDVATLDGPAARAARLLQKALDRYADARPTELDRAADEAVSAKEKNKRPKQAARE
jgi:arylsulfatase A